MYLFDKVKELLELLCWPSILLILRTLSVIFFFFFAQQELQVFSMRLAQLAK